VSAGAAAVTYPPEVVARIAALCEADPAREVCGFVVRRGAALEVVPVANVADRYHAADPARFPRTSRDSYLMDPKTQLRLQRELEAWGGEVVAVWHSHVEVGAYFSEKDRADAVAEGVQIVPGAEYLVVGVRGGRVTEAKRFRWDGRGFVESELVAPPG
jgi:proteasome lid subunit RPN8/RPN11